ISGYIRGRRLSRAVPALLGSSSTILEVALCAGYGSHEAFTRAFRDQFARTTVLILILLVAASYLEEGRQPDLIAIAGF
ncbi:helix-turn-helix domain-containing protein, partial [Rhizobium ruizarguesonis]